MTLADLRRAAELLPPGSAVAVPREALLAVLDDTIAPMTNPNGRASRDQNVDAEQWLTADEVAERLHVSARWAYDHGEQLGARHLSRRCVRFSSRAVDRFKARRT